MKVNVKGEILSNVINSYFLEFPVREAYTIFSAKKNAQFKMTKEILTILLCFTFDNKITTSQIHVK